MGAGASTPGGGHFPNSPRGGMSHKRGLMTSIRGALSSKTHMTHSTDGTKNQKVIRVPLHIAVTATILIQRAIRGYLARKRVALMLLEREQGIEPGHAYHKSLHDVGGATSGKSQTRRSASNDHNDPPSVRSNQGGVGGALRSLTSMVNRNTGFGTVPASSKTSSRPSPGPSPFNKSPQSLRGTMKQQQQFFAPNRLHFGMFSPLAHKHHDDDDDDNHSIVKKMPKDAEVELMPMVGFVVKSKLTLSGKKVFINICHSEHIDCLVATPLREWIDNNHHDDDGEVKMIDILVTDILIPTHQFEEYIKYKHGQGLVTTVDHIKEFIASSCIDFWNSLYTSPNHGHGHDHEDDDEDENENDEELGDLGNFGSLALDDHHGGGLFRNDPGPSPSKRMSGPGGSSKPGSTFSRLQAHAAHHQQRTRQQTVLGPQLNLPKPAYLPSLGTSDSEYIIDNKSFKLPKIKRNYVGRICNLVFNRYTTACDYLEPLTLRDQPHSLVNMVNSCQADCDAIVPPPEIHAMTALAWSAVKISPLNGGFSTVLDGATKKKKKKVGTPKDGKKKPKTPKDKKSRPPSTASSLGPEAISEEEDRDGFGDNDDTETEKEKDKGKDKEKKDETSGDKKDSEEEQKKIMREGYITYCEVYLGMMYLYEKRLAYPLEKHVNDHHDDHDHLHDHAGPTRRPSHAQQQSSKNPWPSTGNNGNRANTAQSNGAPPSVSSGGGGGGNGQSTTTPSKPAPISPLHEMYPPTKCLPGGEREICRILLSHMDVSTTYDETNQLHYLHLELTSDEIDSPFNIEKYYNRFPNGNMNNKGGILRSSVASLDDVFPHRFFGSASEDPMDTLLSGTKKGSTKTAPPGTAASTGMSLVTSDREVKDKNSIVGNIIRDIHKISFQFTSYSQLITWKLFFQGHIDFAYDLLRKISSFNQAPLQGSLMKFHNLLITSQPSGKSFNCQERNQPSKVGSINNNNKALKRKKYHAKLDRGYLGLFMDDITVTPTWSTALEIIPLKYCHLEVKHKKIIRLRNKFLTRVILLTRETRREFFITSELGESDPEIISLLIAWQDNIDYANSMMFRYLAPWLKDIDLLKSLAPPINPTSSAIVPSSASSTTSRNAAKSSLINAVANAVSENYVTCMSSGVQFQISVPEPSTSDDDSDLEDSEKIDEDWEVNQFRIVKPKPPTSPSESNTGKISGPGGHVSSTSSVTSSIASSSLATPIGKAGPPAARQSMIGGGSLSSRGGGFTPATTAAPVPVTPQPPAASSGPTGRGSTMTSPRGRIGSVLGTGNNTGAASTANTNASISSLASTTVAASSTTSLLSTTEESSKMSSDGNNNDDDKDPSSSAYAGTLYDKVMYWKDELSSRFEKFPPSLKNRYFHGHLLYIQESQLLLMMYEFRVFMIMHLTKCIEVIPTKRSAATGLSSSMSSSGLARLSPSSAGGMAGSLASPVLRKKNKTTMKSIVAQEKTNRLYNLDSSDEDEEEDPNNSDRDYENFDDDDEITAMASGTMGQFTTMNDTTHTFMLILMGYDGRKYKLKFYNKKEFLDWKQLLLDRDPNYAKAMARTGTAQNNNGRLSGLPSVTAAQNAASFLAGRASLTSGPGGNNGKENNLSLPSLTGGSNTSHGRSGSATFDASSFNLGLDDKLPEITYDNENTKKYSKQLRNAERVIGCGQVMRHERVMHNSNATNAPKQRRILLVTDLPRMIFIDTIGNVVRGSAELVQESKMEMKTLDGNDFEITVNGSINRFTAVELPEKDGKYWITKVRQAISKL